MGSEETGKTVLRGAFGIYYDQPLVGIFEQNSQTTPPIVNTVRLTGGEAQQPGRRRDRDHVGREAMQATATDFDNPRTIQWNLTVTRRLSGRPSSRSATSALEATT